MHDLVSNEDKLICLLVNKYYFHGDKINLNGFGSIKLNDTAVQHFNIHFYVNTNGICILV